MASMPVGAFVILAGVSLKRDGYAREIYGIVIFLGIPTGLIPAIWFGIGSLLAS